MAKLKFLFLIMAVLTTSFLVGYLVFAWIEPSQAPPGGNVSTPLNVSTNAQTKLGSLSFPVYYDSNDTNWWVAPAGGAGGISGLFQGKVGIGTSTPGAKLHVLNSTGAPTVAIGDANTSASGNNAVAIGNNAIASGNGSCAMGLNVTSSGTNALTFGIDLRSILPRSFTIGTGFDSSNPLVNNSSSSLAIGFNSTVPTLFVGKSPGPANNTTGNVGIGTVNPEFRLDLGTDGGIISKGVTFFDSMNLQGQTLTTSGQGVKFIWYPRKAAFRAGYSEGNEWNEGNIGSLSAALGGSNIARGYSSIALGCHTTTETFASVALGHNTTAAGTTSTAIGEFATANGTNSIVMGKGLDNNNRLVNNTNNSLAIGFSSNIPTLYVGPSSGVGTTGNVGIGTVDPQAKLDVSGEVRISGISGDGTGKVVCIKSDGRLGTCANQPNASGVCTCQ